jgi:hypothetical protein
MRLERTYIIVVLAPPAYPAIIILWPFTITVLEYITDGECQPDLVANLNEDQTHG